MRAPLDLQKYFPPVEDEEWERLISEDLSWQPAEGISVQPYYRRTASQSAGHVFTHSKWLARVDTDLADIASALEAGAEALGFTLPEPASLPQDLPVGEFPLFFRGAGATRDLIQTLRTRAISRGHDPGQLRGAVLLPEQQSPRSALEAAEGIGVWTQVIDLEPWHNLGATHVQELACGLAQLSGLMAELGAKCTAKHVYFRVPVGERYLLDIARLRALRIGASQVLQAYNTRTTVIPVVGVPSRRYESALDPDTHLVRRTLQYAAAITGGCNLVVSPDLGHGLRMLQILKHEGKLGLAADAAAGSWMLEHLTDALGGAAWKLFQKMEAKGGLRKAQSWIEKKIQHAASVRSAAVLSGEQIVTGVNAYLSERIKESVLLEKNLITSLEAVRLRAKILGRHPNVLMHGTHTAWLARVLELCACTIQEEKSADLAITETPGGFLLQNRRKEEVLIHSGMLLPAAADHLLTLLESDAP